ncbi:hypothetical protein ABZ249_08530 [Nocardiopsis sp. NPDC006139]|uniref:hypothetical protein n=1 Tax=Nocardiopsis sp. NPDC006139 TaxID=3154578 RepID=UPI0033B7C975
MAADRLGRAPHSPHFDTDRRPPDMVGFVFSAPAPGTAASTGPWPGTPSADAVALLGTLTATREEAGREHHGTAPDP